MLREGRRCATSFFQFLSRTAFLFFVNNLLFIIFGLLLHNKLSKISVSNVCINIARDNQRNCLGIKKTQNFPIAANTEIGYVKVNTKYINLSKVMWIFFIHLWFKKNVHVFYLTIFCGGFSEFDIGNLHCISTTIILI